MGQDARVRVPAVVERRMPVTEPRAPEAQVPETALALGLARRSEAIASGAGAPDGAGTSVTADAVLSLQKRAGNAAVTSMLHPGASRRASLVVQRRARVLQRAGGLRGPAVTAWRKPAAAATKSGSSTGKSEEEDLDVSEFTNDPKAAAEALATMPKPPPPPPPPSLPEVKVTTAPAKKAPAKKAAGPLKKAQRPVKKGAGARKVAPPGEIVKKPPPPLPPMYVRGAKKVPPTAPVKNPTSRRDPAFRNVAMAAQQTVRAAKAHPKGKDEAASAQAASNPGASHKQMEAEALRAADLQNKAVPKKFDESAFVAAVLQAMEKAKPKNLEEAGDVGSKAAGVKDVVTKQVGASKDGAAEVVEAESQKEPDPSKAAEKPVTEMAPLDLAEPGGVGASSAMPAPVPNDQIDFRAGPAKVDQEMSEAGVTEEQLNQSNEPQFLDALGAKKEGEAHARTAPAEVRKSEGAILKKAGAESASLEKSTVAGAQGVMAKTVQGIGGQKAETKSKDEVKRKEVADRIHGIFTSTRKDVEGILTGLDKKVDDHFAKNEVLIREAFTSDWTMRLDDYKDKRYSGFWGPGRWVHDKVRGLPPAANKLFAKSRAMYESMMKRLVVSIGRMVADELNKATQRIQQGREQVDTYVGTLKGDLATYGQEAAKDVQDKFNDLDADVHDKFQDMADSLAKKYEESRGAIDEEIKSAQDENKGLIDKAVDALRGVYNVVSNLRSLLFDLLKKIAGVVGTIVAHPIRFLQNFVSAVKAGVNAFAENIGTHLQEGLMGWLLGKFDTKGIEIPKSFTLEAMAKLALSVAGVSWATMREKLAKRVGEPGLQAIEKAGDVLDTIRGGPAAMWELVLSKISDFEDMVLGRIKDFIIERVVKAGIGFLVSMLNPAAAFIKACQTIYNLVIFFFEKGKSIMEFVDTVVDAVGDVARGSLGGVTKKIEDSLSKLLPLAIGFLASLLNLGSVGKKVSEIIDRVRKPIHKAIDGILDKIVKVTAPVWKPAKKLFEKGKATYDKGKAKAVAAYEAGKTKVKAGAKKVSDKVKSLFKRQEKGLSMAGHDHTIAAVPRAGGVVITMASVEDLLSTKINAAVSGLRASAAKTDDPQQRSLIEAQIKQLKEIAGIAGNLERKAKAGGHDEVLANGAPPGFTDAMAVLAKKIETFGNTHKVADITKATAESVVVDMRLLSSFGLPMASYLQAQKVVDTHNAAIDIRPTNLTADKLYAAGANPKSAEFKEKTINEDDVLLGAPMEHLGKVAWFNPSRPDKSALAQLAKEEGGAAWIERWWKRWRQRRDEYQEYAAKIGKKLKEGEILLFSRMGGGGSKGGVILDALNGLPFTGDHDIFQVHAGDATATKMLRLLEAAPFRVQHGAHVDWMRLADVVEKGGLDAAETEIFNSIVRSHAVGGKALLRINPKAPPTAVSSATPPLAKPTKKGVGSAPVIEGTVVPALTGFAALEATEKRLKAEAAGQGAAKDAGVVVRESFDVDGDGHELFTDPRTGALTVASQNPTRLDDHSDPQVKKAYGDYLKAVGSAATPAAKKAAAKDRVPAIISSLRKWLKASGGTNPQASAPGVGNVAPHRNQPPRHQDKGVPVWVLESEHTIPRAVSSAAFTALKQPAIAAGGPEYNAQHTVMIYKGAADQKTDDTGGDQEVIRDMKAFASAMSEEVMKTKPSQRWPAVQELVRAVGTLLNAYANDAASRTFDAVKAENRTNGHARGKPGSPEEMVPDKGTISRAATQQAHDILAQLEARLKKP